MERSEKKKATFQQLNYDTKHSMISSTATGSMQCYYCTEESSHKLSDIEVSSLKLKQKEIIGNYLEIVNYQ